MKNLESFTLVCCIVTLWELSYGNRNIDRGSFTISRNLNFDCAGKNRIRIGSKFHALGM